MDMIPPIIKPRIGQCRAGIRRKVKIVLPLQTPAPEVMLSLPETVTQSQKTVQTENKSAAQTDIRQPIGPRIETRQITFYPDQILRPPPKPPDLKENRRDLSDLDMDRNIDFEENSPYQEGIIAETYERPDRSYFKKPSELKDLINTTKLVQKFLPKPMDIDKILDVINRKKVLKGTHLPIIIKEIQAGYLTSPYFKNLYLYLAQNKLLSKMSAIHKVETLAERFISLDSLLFKLVNTPDRETAILAVPEICVDKIITLYHTSLTGHQGAIKTYLIISDKFFIPGLMHYLRLFIKGCHTYQLVRKDKPSIRQLQTRICLSYRSLSRLSMDLKVMPRSQKGHKFILYVITVPRYQSKSEEIGEALIVYT